MTVRYLAEMTKEDLRHRVDDVLVLPLGSTEQHGPHLPLGTDTLLASAVADRAVASVEAGVDVVLGPRLPYGVSPHHVFAGAASLQAATYQQMLRDLLESLASAGFSRFFLLNGHAGNHDSLGVVAKTAPLYLGISVAVSSYWQVLADGSGDAAFDEQDVPGHAGIFETSLMLAVSPHLVATDHLPDSRPDPPAVWAQSPHPGLEVQLPGEWPRVGGYSDPSTGADPAVGQRAFDRIAHEVARAIEAFAAAVEQRQEQRAGH